MNDKVWKDFDGWAMTQEQIDEIKDSYVKVISPYEQQIFEKMIQVCHNSIVLLDTLLKADDYSPECSSDEMLDIAREYIYDPITQQALQYDEVMLEKLFELLKGINKEDKEDKAKMIITKQFEMQRELEKGLYH